MAAVPKWLSNLIGTKLTSFWVGRALINSSGLSADRTYTLPDASGTLVHYGGSIGAAGKVLTVIAGVPAWRDPAGDLTTATDGATVTFDLATSRRQIVTLGGNRTLALSGDADDMAFTIILKQDGTGSRTVTWFSGIKWPGGTTPTLTTTAGKYDVFAFVRIASGEYLGFAGSLNH